MENAKPVKQQSLFYRILHFPLTRIIVGIAICVMIPLLINEFVLRPLLGKMIPDESAEQMVRWILSIGVFIVVYALLFRYYENRPIRELAIRYAAKENALGFLAGGLSVGLILFGLYLAGAFSASTSNSIAVVISPLIMFTLFAITEEIIFRGVLYRITEEWLGTVFALVISALLFALAHITNEHANFLGILSAASGGILLGLLYTLTGRLWIPISFHVGWNFFQYFFGLPVSGNDNQEFYMAASRTGKEWLVGGEFGIESSILAIVLVFGISAWLVYRIIKTGKMVCPLWIRRRSEQA